MCVTLHKVCSSFNVFSASDTYVGVWVPMAGYIPEEEDVPNNLEHKLHAFIEVLKVLNSSFRKSY